MIATDGVFSMDGYIAKLPGICELADKYDALVMVDDSHAVGFMGRRGRGTHEYHDVMQRIDILTGTLGKALGGASGGYTSGRREFIDMLRQRSRPYLFSNSVAPPIVSASIKAIDLLMESTELRDKLERNTQFFRQEITKVGYDVLPGEHPIVPIMLYDAALASRTADALLAKGDLRHRLLVSGRATRSRTHPHTDLGRPFAGRSGVRPGEVCRSPPRIGLRSGITQVHLGVRMLREPFAPGCSLERMVVQRNLHTALGVLLAVPAQDQFFAEDAANPDFQRPLLFVFRQDTCTVRQVTVGDRHRHVIDQLIDDVPTSQVVHARNRLQVRGHRESRDRVGKGPSLHHDADHRQIGRQPTVRRCRQTRGWRCLDDRAPVR